MSAASTERGDRRSPDPAPLGEPRRAKSGGDACARRIERALWWRELSQRRDALFGEELFAEPAFDLLLDLYLADHGVPAARTTPGASWRYFAAMEDRGLIERERDAADPRRARLRLTTSATEMLERFLDQA